MPWVLASCPWAGCFASLGCFLICWTRGLGTQLCSRTLSADTVDRLGSGWLCPHLTQLGRGQTRPAALSGNGLGSF